MPISEAQQRATAKYRKENYDQLVVKIRKGEKALLKAYANDHDESLNSFVKRAINEAIKRESSTAMQLT